MRTLDAHKINQHWSQWGQDEIESHLEKWTGIQQNVPCLCKNVAIAQKIYARIGVDVIPWSQKELVASWSSGRSGRTGGGDVFGGDGGSDVFGGSERSIGGGSERGTSSAS